MTEVSLSHAERSRKAYSKVLQRMQEPGMGVALAASLGVSESTVSRIKSEKLEDALNFVYALGYKVVDQAMTCVPQAELDMLQGFYARAHQNKLYWDGE